MGFSIATFNVKDLFDDQPPHVVAELDRGAFGPAERTLAATLYRAKLEAVAAVVRRLDADLVGFQEVKSARVLDDLRALLPPRAGTPSGGYLPALAGTPDDRGIACGLLSRFPVARWAVRAGADLAFPAMVQGDPPPYAGRLATRRGVLEADLTLPDGSALTLLVLHFKSGLPAGLERADGSAEPVVDQRSLGEALVRSAVMRAAEGLFVRGLVDDVFARNPAAQLAVVGDFNDVESSPTVRAVAGDVARARWLGAAGAAAHGMRGRALFACARAVPEPQRYTVLFRAERQQIDHVLVSEALWARFRGARVLNETLREDVADAGPGDGYSLESDHAPLRADFE